MFIVFTSSTYMKPDEDLCHEKRNQLQHSNVINDLKRVLWENKHDQENGMLNFLLSLLQQKVKAKMMTLVHREV